MYLGRWWTQEYLGVSRGMRPSTCPNPKIPHCWGSSSWAHHAHHGNTRALCEVLCSLLYRCLRSMYWAHCICRLLPIYRNLGWLGMSQSPTQIRQRMYIYICIYIYVHIRVYYISHVPSTSFAHLQESSWLTGYVAAPNSDTSAHVWIFMYIYVYVVYVYKYVFFSSVHIYKYIHI